MTPILCLTGGMKRNEMDGVLTPSSIVHGVTPSVLRPKPTTKSCHEHRVCVIMHVIEGFDKFLVA